MDRKFATNDFYSPEIRQIIQKQRDVGDLIREVYLLIIFLYDEVKIKIGSVT